MSALAIVIICIMCYISIMNTTHIYTLAHPITGVVRYVGKANNLASRLRLHLRKDEHTAKSRWIQSLRAKGLVPVLEVLDIVPQEEWQFWEMYWIAQMKAWGYQLYNGDNGGLGTDRLPDSVKGKIRAKLLRVPQPAKWVPYAQYDLAGNWLQTFASANAAGKAMGCLHNVIVTAARRKMQGKGFLWVRVVGEAPPTIASSYDESGRLPISDEARAKLSAAGKGRKMPPPSAETRAKMRDAKLGKSPINKGVPMTEAQKQSVREASTTRKAVAQSTLAGEHVKTYGSIKEAAEATGIARAGILNSINGKNKHAGGFKWSRP